MADKTIADLPATSAFVAAMLFEVDNALVSEKMTGTQLAAGIQAQENLLDKDEVMARVVFGF